MSDNSSAINAVKTAVAILAKARADCMHAGISPSQFVSLLLPEALLALMIDGQTQKGAAVIFNAFIQEIPEWYHKVSLAEERCHCAREAEIERKLELMAPRKISRGLHEQCAHISDGSRQQE